MNTPIIDPMWFYWMGVADGVRGMGQLLAFFAIVGTIAATIFVCVSKFYSVNGSEMIQKEEWKKVHKCLRNWTIFGWFISIVSLTAGLFVPDKDTIIKMTIAQNVTYENMAKITQTGVELKDGLKKDVIDVINAFNKQEEKK